MRTATFEERFFKNKDEWTYFLSQVGVPEKDYDNISVIEINVDGYKVTDVWLAGEQVQFDNN